jgi:alpha 1,3-glucosidase
MHRDPFTLRIALDGSLTARGEIYLDDGVTYEYKEGHLTWRGLAIEKVSKGRRVAPFEHRSGRRHPKLCCRGHRHN